MKSNLWKMMELPHPPQATSTELPHPLSNKAEKEQTHLLLVGWSLLLRQSLILTVCVPDLGTHWGPSITHLPLHPKGRDHSWSYRRDGGGKKAKRKRGEEKEKGRGEEEAGGVWKAKEGSQNFIRVWFPTITSLICCQKKSMGKEDATTDSTSILFIRGWNK